MTQKNDMNTRVSIIFYGHSIAGVVETFLVHVSLHWKFVVTLIAAGPCRTQSLIRWTRIVCPFPKNIIVKIALHRKMIFFTFIFFCLPFVTPGVIASWNGYRSSFSSDFSQRGNDDRSLNKITNTKLFFTRSRSPSPLWQTTQRSNQHFLQYHQ